MLKNIKNRKNEGFTIIEVLIVLAIAGLIMLLVFLAVPALERDSRNTSRKDDASRVASAISDFVDNSNGQLPAATADCTTVMNDAGTLSQFTGLTCATGAAAVGGDFVIFTTAASYTGPSITKNALVFDPGTVCSGATATTTGATPSSGTLLYDLESGGSSWTWSCIEAD